MGKVVLILGATAVGLGLVSLHLVNRLREGDATIAELREQVASLEQQSRVVETPVFTVGPAPIAAGAVVQSLSQEDEPKVANRPTGQAAPPPVPAHMPSREDALRAMRQHRERERQLMQDPEYRQAMRLQTRNNLARQYPGVIEELGLTRSQAEQFFNMLADHQLRTNEALQPMWEAPPPETVDPAAMQERHRTFQQTANELQQKNEAELAALLGQDKTRAWKEYQSTMGMRYQLDHMRSTLEAQGLPLDEELSKPVLKALAAAQKAEIDALNATARQAASGTTPRLAAAVTFDGNNVDWHLEQTKKRNQRMLDAISSYLTYEQRTAIEKEQQAQIKLQEAQMRLMRERGETNSARGFFSSGSGQMIPLQP